MSYELKVTLREVRPPIWRRVRVAGSLTLRDLHHVLQVALGWTHSHLHEFEIRGHGDDLRKRRSVSHNGSGAMS